ncbi:unnamed protein product [Arabidopsis halleri]
MTTKICNSRAMREGMFFLLDRGGDRISYVEFPQKFEGIDPNDCYANHNTVFFDVSMKFASLVSTRKSH